MKSYFLESLQSREKAASALREILPGQEEPWALTASVDDAIAYFNITESADLNSCCIQADMSGRHYNEDEKVLAILKLLQVRLGGNITGDN